MQLRDRIGCRMKLHDLHVLMAVVQTGSMSKAAALLRTGQPAISRSIAELEYALGVRVLDRNRQGVKPTAYGRALLDGGTAVFDDLRQTVKNIKFLADPTIGELHVGCNRFLAGSFVAAAIDRLSRRHPRMTFQLATPSVDTLHRELIERNVDLLIARRLGSIEDERLDFEFLFDDKYYAVVGAQNPLARRRKIELEELVNEPWVLPQSESALGSVVTGTFRANGLDYPRTTVLGGDSDVRKSLLATGRFISIFPDSALRFMKQQDLKVLSVDQSLGQVPVGIVTLKNRTISPLVQTFINSCREIAKQKTTKK